MKKTASRARVAFFILLGVLALTVGILFIGEKSQLFSPVFFIRVNFSSAAGVKPGSNVVLSGYSVGSVSTLDLTAAGDSVTVTMRVEERIRPFIRNDSKAVIEQEGLVGNKYISLQIGSAEGMQIEDYGFIRGVEPFDLGSVLRSATTAIDTTRYITSQVKELIQLVSAGKGTLGRLLVDESIYQNTARVTARMDSTIYFATNQLATLSLLLSRLTESVQGVVERTDSTIMNANLVTAEAATFMTNINQGRGTAGALLTDRGLYDSLTTLIGLLQNTTIDASNAADQLAKGIYGLRTHWLLGRVFGGPGIEKERPPESSYDRRVRDLQARERALEERERRLRPMEPAPIPPKNDQR